MLQQLRAWFRREYKRHFTNRGDRPPPYDCLSLTSCALTPLAQHDPAIAASYNADLTASAITARSIAEGPDIARAVEKAMQRIHTAVPEIIRVYGLEHDHRLAASIWARAISGSTDTARIIAQSPNRSYAIDFARKTEAELADGSADALLLYILDYIGAGRGVPVRHRLSTEPSTDKKDKSVEQIVLKTSPDPPAYGPYI